MLKKLPKRHSSNANIRLLASLLLLVRDSDSSYLSTQDLIRRE